MWGRLQTFQRLRSVTSIIFEFKVSNYRPNSFRRKGGKAKRPVPNSRSDDGSGVGLAEKLISEPSTPLAVLS